jgi:hypothetical protein
MGFVMSGNRKKRKTSEDAKTGKKGFDTLKEEKMLRETEIVEKFREMIQERRGLGTGLLK